MKFVLLIFLWLFTFRQDCFAQSAQKVHLDNDSRGRMPVSVFRNAKKLVSSDPSSKVLSATAYFMGSGFPDKDTVKINGESLKPLKKWMDRAVPGTIVYFDDIRLSDNTFADPFGIGIYDDNIKEEPGSGRVMLDVISNTKMSFVAFKKNNRLVSTNRGAKIISGIAHFMAAGFPKTISVPFIGDSLSQLKKWTDQLKVGSWVTFTNIKVLNRGITWDASDLNFILVGFENENVDSVIKNNKWVTYQDIMAGIDPGNIILDNFSKHHIPLSVLKKSKEVLVSNKEFKVIYMTIEFAFKDIAAIHYLHVDDNSLASLQEYIKTFSVGASVIFRVHVSNGKVEKYLERGFQVMSE